MNNAHMGDVGILFQQIHQMVHIQGLGLAAF